MALPAPGIIRVIKKYQTEHEIIRFTRDTTGYDDNGIADPNISVRDSIKGHHQPLGKGKLIRSLPEGERSEDVKKWWTLEETNEKDKIIIDGVIYTVNAVAKWANYRPVFTEADLLRTGEADNID